MAAILLHAQCNAIMQAPAGSELSHCKLHHNIGSLPPFATGLVWRLYAALNFTHDSLAGGGSRCSDTIPAVVLASAAIRPLARQLAATVFLLLGDARDSGVDCVSWSGVRWRVKH